MITGSLFALEWRCNLICDVRLAVCVCQIYRLLSRNTYEMHMFERASLKLGLDRAILTQVRKGAEARRGEAGAECFFATL